MRTRWFVAVLAVALAMSAGVWAQNQTTGRAVAQDAVKEPAPPPSITVIGARDAHGILGREVRSAADENMGRIVDVLVDGQGVTRAAIIDFGGFLGVGNRKIAVDWRALNFAPAGKPGRITLELTRNQVRVAPEYKQGEPVVVLGAAGSERAMPSSGAATPEK